MTTQSSRPRRCLRGQLLPVIARVVMLAGALVTLASNPASAQQQIDPELAGTSADSALMSDLFIAELAGRRGRVDVALEGYLRAYPRTGDFRVARRAARLAIFSQQWPEAQAAIEHWLQLDQRPDGAHQMLAQVLLRQGQADATADAFVAMIAGAGNTDEAWQLISDILQTDPDQPLARAVADRLASLTPDRPEPQVLYARLALAAGDREAADRAIDAALTRAPGYTAARVLRAQRSAEDGDIDAALEALAEARQAAPEDLQLRMGEAELLVEAERIEEAKVALLEAGSAIVEGGTSMAADALLRVALLSTHIGELDAAERWFFELLQTDNFVEQATFQLARISDEQGDVEHAIARYEAVPAGELYVSSQVRAAELRAAEDDLATARERLQTLRANVADPFVKPQILATEGRLIQQSGAPEAAIDLMTAGLREYPDNSALLYTRALAADTAGLYAILEEDLQRLIAAEPDNAHALNALGYHYADENIKLDTAAGYIERARSLLPEDPAITDSLGWLRYRQGRYDEAVGLLREAWSLLPDPEIARHLVEVLWRQGKEAEAKLVHEEALRLAPDDEALRSIFDSLVQ